MAVTRAAQVPRLVAEAFGIGLLAGLLVGTDLVVLAGYDPDPVWVWLQVPVVLLACTAPLAWLRRRWSFAGVGLLAMLGGLWGYLYLPPLVALVLAAVAFRRAARARIAGTIAHHPMGT